MQIAIDVIFGVEKLRQLSDGEPVTHRQRKVRREGSLVRIQHRPFNNGAAHGIRSVQHIERDLAFRRFFHAIRHRCRVRIKANARILHIKHQRVDTLQHFVGRPHGLAIQAENGQAGLRVFFRCDFFVIAAGKPVLGAKERYQVHSRSVRNQVCDTPSLGIEARMISN